VALDFWCIHVFVQWPDEDLHLRTKLVAR